MNLKRQAQQQGQRRVINVRQRRISSRSRPGNPAAARQRDHDRAALLAGRGFQQILKLIGRFAACAS